MNQVEKIKHMEQNLNEVSEVLKALDEAIENYAGVRKQLDELSEYYGSEEWFRDFDDDNAGKLPPDLRRGVLSEDAVYNLLMENRRLLDRMQEVAKKHAAAEKSAESYQVRCTREGKRRNKFS